MASGMPSMTALLALLAVAGYQHRDRIAEMVGGAGGGGAGAGSGPADEAGQRGGAAVPASASAGIGGMIGGGLKELMDRFRQAGHAETAESWVAHGPNRDLAPGQLEKVLDPETLETISRQTGLPREEVLTRLTRELPSAVDRYTPDGRIPS
jgi:uncharacterized protein YidB (DUF937 family)